MPKISQKYVRPHERTSAHKAQVLIDECRRKAMVKVPGFNKRLANYLDGEMEHRRTSSDRIRDVLQNIGASHARRVERIRMIDTEERITVLRTRVAELERREEELLTRALEAEQKVRRMHAKD